MPYLPRVDTEAKQVSLKPAGSPVAVCSRPLQTKSEPLPCREVDFGFCLGFFRRYYTIRARVRALKFNGIKKNDKNTCKALNLGLHAYLF